MRSLICLSYSFVYRESILCVCAIFVAIESVSSEETLFIISHGIIHHVLSQKESNKLCANDSTILLLMQIIHFYYNQNQSALTVSLWFFCISYSSFILTFTLHCPVLFCSALLSPFLDLSFASCR